LNTIILDGSVPNDQLRDWVDHSYDLAVKDLKNSDRGILLKYPKDTKEPPDVGSSEETIN
jgi:hypothetical protein